MDDAVHLGPFVLGERIGTGGMGAVYAAQHADTGGRAAIKVLLGRLANQPDKRRDFRREVRAMARLGHPGIATVFDHGRVSAEAASAGDAALVEGALWLAMERVDARPLSHVAHRWTWPELGGFLQATLDALAHAHAHDVIHRDLKPSNILVADDGASVKLVDFGIARIFDDTGASPDELGSDAITGTPKYMAPEQVVGQWRDQGPWTDLYALACIAWFIACGRPVFGGSVVETLEAHVATPPPAFQPRIAVPAGFEPWLRALLAKRPARRVSRAADARWALDRLGAPLAASVAPPPGRSAAASDDPDEPTERLEAPPTLQLTAGHRPTTASPAAGPTPPITRPPVPEHWQDDAPAAGGLLPRAGLRLFGLRTVPMVGRREERDALWAALRQVDAEAAPRLVFVEGGPGYGKSRLVRWLARRAHEVGAAEVLTAVHTAAGSPADGLRGLVRRWARTDGLSRGEVHQRLLEWLPALAEDRGRHTDARALTEYLRPSRPDEPVAGPPYRFTSARQEHALIARFVARVAQARPVILWLDDLQWADETVGAIDYLLTSAPLRTPHRLGPPRHGQGAPSAWPDRPGPPANRVCPRRVCAGRGSAGAGPGDQRARRAGPTGRRAR